MGTENDQDVEGQTEPPIRGFNQSACPSPFSTPSPTLAGTSGATTDGEEGRAGSITSTPTTLLTPESAHTLSVPDVCTLLDTDPQ